MSESQQTVVKKRPVDLWPMAWSVFIFCTFVFTRGCDGEPSHYELWIEAAYPPHYDAAVWESITYQNDKIRDLRGRIEQVEGAVGDQRQ